jgi:flagellar hook-associated protein 2
LQNHLPIMANINVSSLTSTAYGSFDWQTMVNQLIQVDTAPITKLQAEETANKAKVSSLSSLNTGLSGLQDDVKALQDSSVFTARTVSASGSGWTPTAANGAATGSYSIQVQHLATAARRNGAPHIAASLSNSDNVDGLTLATLPTATAVTAGTFTVDGRQVTIALTDSLAQALQKISDATLGKVTAKYDHTIDGITLASTDGSEVELGTVTDTSNFLQAMHLANNTKDTVSSSAVLGATSLTAPIASAHLRAGITAVDPDGNGSFSINGVSVAYNVNTDSLQAVLARVNASTAGVKATYDSTNDRVVLANATTGDVGIAANEASGGLLDALGLTSASTLQHGQNAVISINGGDPITSATNTLDSAALGIDGLSLTVNSETTQTVNVGVDTASMKTVLQKFIDDYNTVQGFISDQTQVSIDSNGKVTTATLVGNLEIQNVSTALRARAFASVPGLTGTVKRLEDLGIDFNTAGQMSIKDSTKLDKALAQNSNDVAAFFGTPTTGFSANIYSYLGTVLTVGGGLSLMSDHLVSQDNAIETQIAALQTQLDNERTTLTTAFEAMQSAQTLFQTQSKYLDALYNSSKSSNG